MLQNRDIIFVGLQAWDTEIDGNAKRIAMELAVHNRVLYVNAPLDRQKARKEKHNPRIIKRKNIINGKLDELIQVSDNIWTLYPRILIQTISQIGFNPVFDLFNLYNNLLLAHEIQAAIKKLNFHKYILFNDSDVFRSYFLHDLLKPTLYVYYSRNNLISLSYWKKQGVRMETKQINKADLVLSNSTFLTQIAKEINPNTFFVGQAYDVSIFNPKTEYTIPTDIASITPPIIGFVGTLKALRLDIDILLQIAQHNSQWQIVLIGPEDENFKESTLHQQSNVHFLGNKDAGQIPAYMAQFDVAINPQRINFVTNANYPRKVDEYLAMGKPTVTTHTASMDFFKGYVSLAKDGNEFCAHIESALKNEDTQKYSNRIRFARQHSWAKNAELISELIENAEKNMF